VRWELAACAPIFSAASVRRPVSRCTGRQSRSDERNGGPSRSGSRNAPRRGERALFRRPTVGSQLGIKRLADSHNSDRYSDQETTYVDRVWSLIESDVHASLREETEASVVQKKEFHFLIADVLDSAALNLRAEKWNQHGLTKFTSTDPSVFHSGFLMLGAWPTGFDEMGCRPGGDCPPVELANAFCDERQG
jgi:hypothetical protein